MFKPADCFLAVVASEGVDRRLGKTRSWFGGWVSGFEV